MKLLKISFVLFTLTLFIIACAQNNSTNNTSNTTVNTRNTNSSVPTGATPAPPQPADDELAEARNIYKESCVGCHKEDGAGGEKTIDGKKIKVPSYKGNGAMKATDDELYDYIANGEEGEMPAFKDKLTEAQMRNLVKFIRKEFQGK